MAETKTIPFSSREEEQPEDNWPAPKVGKRQRDQVNRAASRFFIFQILIHRHPQDTPTHPLYNPRIPQIPP